MNLVLPGLLGVLLYLLGATLQFAAVVGRRAPQLGLVRAVAVLAGFAHGWFVVHAILPAEGLDLGLFRVLALVSLTMVAVIFVFSLTRPLENLYVVLFPFAALTLTAALLFESHARPSPDLGAGFVVHVILALLAYSVLSVAVCQSLLVAWQERQLRSRKAFALLRNLPPLQTMEGLLFELLWVGLVLLTLAIGSGAIFLEDLFAQHVVHHTVLSSCSWVVFAILLWGRHRLGWRGRTAIRWTLTGFGLLMLAYFGSKLVLEVILGR
jgi:ABC-type uncharacterized transport system permease subunit